MDDMMMTAGGVYGKLHARKYSAPRPSPLSSPQAIIRATGTMAYLPSLPVLGVFSLKGQAGGDAGVRVGGLELTEGRTIFEMRVAL